MASTVRMLIILGLFFGIVATSHGSESEEFETFIEGIIETWKLRSPTIVVKDDLPKICMSKNPQWLLCLSNDQDTNELANHLASIHPHRQQDGLIFVGSQGHEKLLKQLSEGAPSILTLNYPVFMPISYQKDIQLRLDSNIYFYRDIDISNYEVYDIFAVKAGPDIALEVGKWNFDDGMTLSKSMNRWNRRTNLQQTIFINCLVDYPPWAQLTKDKHGNINGSKGYFQDMVFYITDKLNLTVETKEHPWAMKLLDNGSWTGAMGLLQRQEVDTVSTGFGINVQRSKYIDYPIATNKEAVTLIAAIPKSASPNVWVYVKVFGLTQWMIFIMFLVLMVIALSLILALSDDKSGWDFGTKRGTNQNYQLDSASSALAMVCLYVLQMGSHTNSTKLAPRLLTFTMSILTLLFFVFYTGDITAQMTSGPSSIPIKNFEDVVKHDYKVVTHTPFYERLLAGSKPGSAKHEIYTNNFKRTKDKYDSMNAVIQDPDLKTLFYAYPSNINPTTPQEKILTDQAFGLKMDDSVNAYASLGLQKNSEFTQIFSHYILKALEGGEFKRLFRSYYIDLFTKENFEMTEAQPLRLNNVMFCFTCLGFGICISLIKVMMEFTIKKISKDQKPAKNNERGETANHQQIVGQAWDKHGTSIEKLD